MKFSNMIKINVVKSKFNLYYDEYSQETLKTYRNIYQNTHAFFRYIKDDEDIIIIFPLNKEAKDQIVTNNTICIDTTKDHFLIKKFIHEIVFRKVLDTKVAVESYRKIRFLSRKKEDDVLNDILIHTDNIGYKKGYEIETRLFFPVGQPLYTICVNSFYRWNIDLSCKEIIDKNISLIGLYACEYIKSDINLLAGRRVLLGKIIDCNNQICKIEKGGGIEKKESSKTFIENNFKNRNEILKLFLEKKVFDKCINKIKSDNGIRRSAESQINDVNNILNWLKKESLDNDCGFSFTIVGNFSDKSKEWTELNLKQPTYIFNFHGSKTETHPDKGLRTFGPHDSPIFTPKRPKIAVICRKSDRGTVTNFLDKLINGLPDVVTRNGFLPYGDGFIKKYGLTDIQWCIYEFDIDTLSMYEDTISRCIRNEEKVDLAIIQTSLYHKELAYKDSPYFLSKAKFMSNNIPVQAINIETMKKPDSQLVYTLNNIALACYAKMGGSPWVIPSNKSIDRELVIGLGSAIFKKDRFKNYKRIVGITTVFNSDGRYILNSKSDEVRFENYFEALLSNLIKIFEEVKNTQGWQSDDTVRLVFHCFKPFKNKEIYAIKKLVENLNLEFDVKFAFLHVSNNQPLFFIDNQMEGVKSYDGKNLKGRWMPERGKVLKLDDENSLIQLTGAKDIKMHSHGMAKPVMIKLHNLSTYKDIDYLSQQLYYFASMSHRSFSNAPLPVTIWYSQLIAKLMGSLSEIPTWDFDIMANKLKYSRWFL